MAAFREIYIQHSGGEKVNVEQNGRVSRRRAETERLSALPDEKTPPAFGRRPCHPLNVDLCRPACHTLFFLMYTYDYYPII